MYHTARNSKEALIYLFKNIIIVFFLVSVLYFLDYDLNSIDVLSIILLLLILIKSFFSIVLIFLLIIIGLEKEKICSENIRLTKQKTQCVLCFEEYSCTTHKKIKCVNCEKEIYLSNKVVNCNRYYKENKGKDIIKKDIKKNINLEDLYAEIVCLNKKYLIKPSSFEEFIKVVELSDTETITKNYPLIFNIYQLIKSFNQNDEYELKKQLKSLEPFINDTESEAGK